MSRPLVLLVDDNQELAHLLAQVFEEAGYRTRVCYRGRAAIDAIAEEPPAVAIVDVLLPDVMGFEVGKALQARDIPYVYATGVFKGPSHARDGTDKHGARAYFEKPFASGALLAAIKEMVPPGELEDPEGSKADFEVELDFDVEESDHTPQSPLDMTGRIAVAGPTVSAVLTGADFRLGQTPKPMIRNAPPPLPAKVQPGERRGALHDNLPQLITAFWQLQETGELGLQRGKVKKVVYFEKGQPVFALSNLAVDRFGNFLVRVGKITEPQLREAAARASEQKRRTGDVLIEMGLLQDAERMYYVAQQVKAILYSLFAWSEGEYVMSFRAKAAREPIRLGVHPAQLISRGIKKLYKPDRLQRLLALEDRLRLAKDPVFQPSELELDPWEAALLSRVDGQRNVAELLALAGKPAHMVYASLVVLLSVNTLEKA